MNKDELPELPPKLLQDFHHFEQACRYESQRTVGEIKESLFDQMREYALAALQAGTEPWYLCEGEVIIQDRNSANLNRQKVLDSKTPFYFKPPVMQAGELVGYLSDPEMQQLKSDGFAMLEKLPDETAVIPLFTHRQSNKGESDA